MTNQMNLRQDCRGFLLPLNDRPDDGDILSAGWLCVKISFITDLIELRSWALWRGERSWRVRPEKDWTTQL